MTVSELKRELNKFDDNLLVLFPDDNGVFGHSHITHLSKGINYFEDCVVIDNYIESEEQ